MDTSTGGDRSDLKTVHTFIVRLWREPVGEESGAWEWRGEVRDAITAERRFFRRLRGMIRVIAEMSGNGGESRRAR